MKKLIQKLSGFLMKRPKPPVHYFVSYSHADGFGNKVVELDDIGFFPYADVAVFIGNKYNEKDVVILQYKEVPKKQYDLSK